jgi:hypothetical protein
MNRQLTPTELKTLATEGANRINTIVQERIDKILKSKEYLNFEKDFARTTLGQNFSCLIALAKDVDKAITVEKPDKYYSRVQRDIESTQCSFLSWYKSSKFPMPSINALVPEGFENMKGWRTTSVQEYLCHQLSIAQLTKGSKEITELLDKLVKELVLKIK